MVTSKQKCKASIAGSANNNMEASEMVKTTNDVGAEEAKAGTPVSAWTLDHWIFYDRYTVFGMSISKGERRGDIYFTELAREGHRSWIRDFHRHVIGECFDGAAGYQKRYFGGFKHVIWVRNRKNVIVGEVLLKEHVFYIARF